MAIYLYTAVNAFAVNAFAANASALKITKPKLMFLLKENPISRLYIKCGKERKAFR